MPREWVLNSAMNQWKLNQKKNVGPTSKEIRKCRPKNKEDWEKYYYENVKPKEIFEISGKKLFKEIKTTLTKEIDEITEEDCINYMHEVVINRTFNGYMTEIHAVYNILEPELNVKIHPAPDEWDRKFNVDYYIKIKDNYIGLQIKSIKEESGEISHIMNIYTEREIESDSHIKFKKHYGEVFYIYSTKKGKNTYKIVNENIITQIKKEIDRLKNL